MTNLIESVSELKSHVPDFMANMDEGKFLSLIRDTQIEFMPAIFGRELSEWLYAKVSQQRKGAKALDKVFELLAFVNPMLAWFAYKNAVKQGFIQHGNAGNRSSRGENTDNIRLWEHQLTDSNAEAKGYLYAEEALAFLEKNADSYPIWRQSPGYTKLHDTYINSISEFEKYEHLDGNRRSFIVVKLAIRAITEREVPRIIGEERHTELISKLSRGAELQDRHKELLKYIRPTVAAQAMYDSLPRLALMRFGAFGYYRQTNGLSSHERPTTDEYNAVANEFKQRASQNWTELRDYIKSLTPSASRQYTNYRGIFSI
jgi:hypothetical protein